MSGGQVVFCTPSIPRPADPESQDLATEAPGWSEGPCRLELVFMVASCDGARSLLDGALESLQRSWRFVISRPCGRRKRFWLRVGCSGAAAALDVDLKENHEADDEGRPRREPQSEATIAREDDGAIAKHPENGR